MPIISIIVPIYNIEKTLQRCIRSIINQTFKNWELILVDDGSTDNCSNICDEFANQDYRIKVIHKKNGGVSSARQCALENISGEYSIHIDPDDWVDDDMLAELYEKAKKSNADMVLCDYILELPHKTTYIQQFPNNLNCDNLLHLYLTGKLHASLCNKLIRTKCYKDINFPIGINYKEDLYVISNMLIKENINHITYLNKAFYHYNKTRNNSITSKITKTIFDAQLFITDYFVNTLDKEQFKEELIQLQIKTKLMALELGFLNNEQFIELYGNINKNIQISYKIKDFIPSFSLYISINGMYKFGCFLFKMWNNLISGAVKIYKLFKK